MNVGYYIQRCKGDVDIDSNGELLRHGTAENMKSNMEASFKPLKGFSDNIWLMEVKDFRIVGNRLDLIV